MKAGARKPAQLSRKILSRAEEIDGLCLEIRALLKARGLASTVFGVELLARECLNNAAKHGNGGDTGKRVALNLRFSRREIRLRVADQGRGFNWKRVLEAPPPRRTATSGRGLMIIGAYAERVRFNPRGNEITLWLRGPEAD